MTIEPIENVIFSLAFLSDRVDLFLQLPVAYVSSVSHVSMVELLLIVVLLVIIFTFGVHIRTLQRALRDQDKENSESKERNEQTELALHSCHIYPWVYNPANQRLSYLSKNRAHLYPPQLSLDYFLDHYILPDYRKNILMMLEDTINGKIPSLNIRAKMISADNESVEWAHFVGLPVGWDPVRECVLKVIGTIHYVTKEVELENELKENRDFLELTMRTANIIPWEYFLDKDLLISKTPSRSELVKPILMSDYTKYIVHPEWREDYTREVEAVKEGRRNNSIDYKLKVLGTGGEYEWSRIVGVVISWDERGKPLRMIGSTYQIDQEMRRTEQLDKLRNAEEANRLKTAFLANISHEIRTPLNAIVGFSQLLMDSPEDYQEFLPIIETNNKLLIKLVEDILDISKIESGDLNFDFQLVNLNELFSTLLNTYKFQIPSDIKFANECPDELYVLYSDKKSLLQVMNNLLNNAIKFTQKGVIRMGYSVQGGDHVRFFVRDTGIGIKPYDQSRVFERFTKLDSFVQGTGLGLSICEMIVHKLGGEIGVESTYGEGSEFWFTVPVSEMKP